MRLQISLCHAMTVYRIDRTFSIPPDIRHNKMRQYEVLILNIREYEASPRVLRPISGIQLLFDKKRCSHDEIDIYISASALLGVSMIADEIMIMFKHAAKASYFFDDQ